MLKVYWTIITLLNAMIPKNKLVWMHFYNGTQEKFHFGFEVAVVKNKKVIVTYAPRYVKMNRYTLELHTNLF